MYRRRPRTGYDTAPLPVADPDRRNPFFRDVFQQSYQSEPLNMPAAAPVWRWNGGRATAESA